MEKNMNVTKEMIICYTIMKNGPSTWAKIMAKAADVQATVPGMNRPHSSRWTATAAWNQDLIVKVGSTETGEHVWDLTDHGMTLALYAKPYLESLKQG